MGEAKCGIDDSGSVVGLIVQETKVGGSHAAWVRKKSLRALTGVQVLWPNYSATQVCTRMPNSGKGKPCRIRQTQSRKPRSQE